MSELEPVGSVFALDDCPAPTSEVTLNPQPSTLNPQPSLLNPQPGHGPPGAPTPLPPQVLPCVFVCEGVCECERERGCVCVRESVRDDCPAPTSEAMALQERQRRFLRRCARNPETSLPIYYFITKLRTEP